MRRITAAVLVLVLAAGLLSGCSATAEELTGEAQGYGGRLTVLVSVSGDRIAEVRVTEHHETEGVGTKAIEALPGAIAAANSVNVDAVSGATVTSNAIKQAVAMAIGQADAQPAAAGGMRRGVGLCATGRLGPGKDAAGKPDHMVNIVAAGASFDDAGRIVSLAIDQIEAAVPASGGEVTPETGAAFLAEVAGWTTKGMRGDSYMMPAGSWLAQMDAYERLFTGMTVDEAEAWFRRCCSDETGRPLKADAGSEADQTKYAALSDEDLAQLAEVTSSATISLRDEHGDVITAIRRAWEDAQRAENRP